MKIMLFGAQGQLGLDIQDVCQLHDATELKSFSRDDVDISDTPQLEKAISSFEPDYIINSAAYTKVDQAEEEKELAMKINADAVKQLGRISDENGAVLLHVSTDYVFNGEKNTPYGEEEECQPIGYYGETKLQGERALMALNASSAIIRTSWLYSSRRQNFLRTMVRLGNDRDELSVVFDQVGTPTYARDLATTLVNMALSGYSPDGCEVFHFGNEGVCSWYDFAAAIMNIGGINCQVKPIESKDFPTKTKRPPYSVLNKTKIKKTFGFDIRHWQEALIDCMSRLKD